MNNQKNILFVKSILVLIFLLLNISAKSQFFKNFGIREYLSVNIFHSEPELLPAFTTFLTYNKNDLTIVGGPAVCQRMIDTKESAFKNSLDKYFRISGFTLGSKYRIKQYSNTSIYGFIENMLLSYSSYEHFSKFGDSRTPSGISLIINDWRPHSRTLVLQPLIGNGIDIEFLNI